MPENYNIADLAKLMRQAKAKDIPFVFFTGAGCSVAAGIPLASELVEEMRTRFETELRSLNDTDRQNYGKCMSKIGRHDRRKFLKKYIDNAKINWAHIALACLLKEGYIGRVLTFNFDNLLARSCGLLGLYPATYDFTAANLNLYHLIENPAVVHLHGQIHGFSQLNSDKETASHAEQLSEFIRSTLNESPALFIGYSGQADAFFPQITKHYSGQHRLFWVGMEKQAPSYVAEPFLQTDLAHYMCCADGGSDVFLIELARELECFPPLIFTDPYKHMLEELEAVSGYPQKESDQSPPKNQDILQGIKKRLEKARTLEHDKKHPNYLQLYLQGKHEEIINHSKSVECLNDENEIHVANAYFGLAFQQDDLEGEIKVYDELIERFSQSHVPAVQIKVARALLNKGISLQSWLEDPEGAIAAYDELIRCFSKNDLTELQEWVASALLLKGTALGQKQPSEEAIAVYDEIIQKFSSLNTPAVQSKVAAALVHKGIEQCRLGKLEDAITTYDKMIEIFASNDTVSIQDEVAEAFLCKGVALSQLGCLDEAITIYDRLVEHFSLNNLQVGQKQTVEALFNKCTTLIELERPQEAIVVYNELIHRFGESSVQAIQETVTKAKEELKKVITLD